MDKLIRYFVSYFEKNVTPIDETEVKFGFHHEASSMDTEPIVVKFTLTPVFFLSLEDII